MKTFSEARGDTAIFTFGRFNPPTTGHEKLIDALAKQQGKNAGSLMYVYPSHSQDAKKNPLPHARKIAYMKKMFRKYAKNIITSKSKNVFDIAVELHNKGHKAVVMVVGSDRVEEFDRLLNTYNGVDGKHGYYGFDDIKVVSAGDRDPDAEGVEGMSASKMRAAAAQGDFDSFQQGLPRNFGDGKKLFDDIRKNMGVREQNWTDEEIMRDAYIRGEVWNVGDVVETKLGDEGTIIRKGTNYVVFENMQRVWLHDLVEEPKKITKTKQAKGDVADVKGTQPAKYYSKDAEGDDMSKSTKIARARHFAKGGSRGKAPGDANAKTKPSQYTKKFKQMYGEQDKKKEPAKSDQEKERDEFKKLQKDKKIAALQFRMAKDAETVAKLSAMERKLSDGEKDKLKKLEKDIDKKDFIDRYGKEEGESIYYATLTKLAKGESIEEKDNPCWDTHKQVGMKKKNGKMVPNCVPKESYEIGKDYAQHTFKIDPHSAPQNLDEKIEGLVNKSKQTGVPYSILKKSYDRGMAAWKGGHRPGASQQQWAFARVNSMLTGGKADPDLQKQIKAGGYKKKKKKEEFDNNVKSGLRPHSFSDTPSSKKMPINAKKKIKKYDIDEWYEDDETIMLYQGRYGDEWLKKLNNTYEAMLSKLDEEPCCDDCSEHFDHIVEAAEYQGKKVKLNDPIRTSENPKKKFKVYVKNEKGTVVVVRFGDPNMGINRDDPGARKNFRARHNCDDPGPKWKARYWSCYQWRAGAKVDN